MEVTMGASVMSVKDLFREAFALYRNRFAVFASIMGVPVVLSFFGAAVKSGFYVNTVLIIVSSIVYLIAYVAIIAAARGSDARESYRTSLSIFFSYAWLVFLTNILNIGGLIMGIVPAIIFSIWFAFAPFLLVDTGARGFEAILKSKEYVRGLWWPLFLRLMLIGLIVGFFNFGIAKIAETFGNPLAATYAAQAITQFFFVPFVVSYAFTLYRNVRAAKPNLADAPVNEKGKGFFIFAAVLGVVGPLLLTILVMWAYISSVAPDTSSEDLSSKMTTEEVL